MVSYTERRAKLAAQMQAKGGGVAVIATAPEATRSNDSDYPYRHDSSFYYLTGFTEPEAVLVLAAGGGRHQSVLFCREKNVEREIWDGFRHGPEGARTRFGFDAAHPITALDTEMGKLLADAPALFYGLGRSARLDAQIQGWLAAVRRQGRSGICAPASAHDLAPLLNEMRLFKDEGEAALMRRACAISAAAHSRAMRTARPGMFEYEIEAELLHEFRRNGSQFPAYNSIVAAGANACILHYGANNVQTKDGDLVLIDAGCELDGYASDLTRTFPVNGTFSGPQRALYELVLASQHAALAAVRPGAHYNAVHDAAVEVLAQGMLDLGLLDRDKVGGVRDVVEKKSYKQFYMHGTGHWIGMDVHDVGEYRDLSAPAPQAGAERPHRRLAPGMVLTVEPGIYVRPEQGVPEQFWNIGIRIEDDVLVTADGMENLSAAAPTGVAEIEALMRA